MGDLTPSSLQLDQVVALATGPFDRSDVNKRLVIYLGHQTTEDETDPLLKGITAADSLFALHDLIAEAMTKSHWIETPFAQEKRGKGKKKESASASSKQNQNHDDKESHVAWEASRTLIEGSTSSRHTQRDRADALGQVGLSFLLDNLLVFLLALGYRFLLAPRQLTEEWHRDFEAWLRRDSQSEVQKMLDRNPQLATSNPSLLDRAQARDQARQQRAREFEGSERETLLELGLQEWPLSFEFTDPDSWVAQVAAHMEDQFAFPGADDLRLVEGPFTPARVIYLLLGALVLCLRGAGVLVLPPSSPDTPFPPSETQINEALTFLAQRLDAERISELVHEGDLSAFAFAQEEGVEVSPEVAERLEMYETQDPPAETILIKLVDWVVNMDSAAGRAKWKFSPPPRGGAGASSSSSDSEEEQEESVFS